MRRSSDYYRACNELVRALEEINMWIESMSQAILQLETVTGDEKINLAKYIKEEIERLDLKVSLVKKKFKKSLNGRIDLSDMEMTEGFTSRLNSCPK